MNVKLIKNLKLSRQSRILKLPRFAAFEESTNHFARAYSPMDECRTRNISCAILRRDAKSLLISTMYWLRLFSINSKFLKIWREIIFRAFVFII